MIVSLQIFREYSLPLIKPLRMKGTTQFTRRGLILEAKSEKNSVYSDICPFPNLHSETIDDVKIFFYSNADLFSEIEIDSLEDVLKFETLLISKFGIPKSLSFAISMACLELLNKERNTSLGNLFGNNDQNELEINGLITGDINEVVQATNELIAKGYSTLKIKVGSNSIEYDIARIDAIKDLLRDNKIKLRLDANRAWTLEQAVDFCESTQDVSIEYIEEPLQDIRQLKELYDSTGINIALDETLYEKHSLDYIKSLSFIKAFVIKPSVLGSLGRLIQLSNLAKEMNIQLVFSSIFESGIGMKQLIALASSFGELGTVHGFDTYKWLFNDVYSTKLDIEKPEIYASIVNYKDEIHSTINLNHKGIALIHNDREISYSSLKDEIEKLSYTLDDLLEPSVDKVAIAIEDKYEFIKVFFAVINSGRIAVAINTKLPTDAVESLLLENQINLLITDNEDFFGKKVSNSACSLYKELSIIKNSDFAYFEQKGKIELNLINAAPSTILFTSGSSSKPKAVLHTLQSHISSAKASIIDISDHECGMNENSLVLISLPLYHAGGLSLLYRAIISGARMISTDMQKLSNNELQSLTHISFVPTQLNDLIDSGKIKLLRNIKMLFVGGSSVPEKLLEKAFEYVKNIYLSYGSTELASTIYRLKYSPEAHIGQLLPHCEMRIDESNEILAKGSSLFLAYLNNDEWITPFDSEGWFHTGDLGKFDERGNLLILGRQDNVFISGGENISPEEIEKYLNLIEGIDSSVVVAIDNDRYGKRPVAFINSKKNINTDEIIKELAGRLPKFKIPDYFFPMPEQDESLKISRRELEKLASVFIVELI
jgi:o-succinylbenzoate---CoA ligase